MDALHSELVPLNIIWDQAGIGAEYREPMQQVFSHFFHELASQQDAGKDLSILDLPALCCEAISGVTQADAFFLASAWVLLLGAAHLLDTIEDGDTDQPWVQRLGPGPVINLATGWIFTAEQMLTDLEGRGIPAATAQDLRTEVNRSILRMCSGQHRDMTVRTPTLEQAWQTAGDKSGEFFRLACFLGARLASADPGVLAGFAEFGRQMGIIKQIKDDIADLWDPAAGKGDLLTHKWSLPVCYALHVLPEEKASRLRTALDQPDPTVAHSCIMSSGAQVYLALEIKKRQKKAVSALVQCCSPSPAREKILSILEQLGTSNPNAANQS